MSDAWYLTKDGAPIGPISLRHLKAVIQKSADWQTQLVWRQGLGDWVEASTLVELAPAPHSFTQNRVERAPTQTNQDTVYHKSRRVIIGLSMSLGALLLGGIVVMMLQQPPTTVELDGDLSVLRQQISEVESESEKYTGGAIKILLEVRKHILLNTEAMLVQKRNALIRRVSLAFAIKGRELSPATDAELKDILEEIDQADKKLSASLANAERYSGGLTQAMALMSAETDKLSVAQLRLKFYSMKHGLPLIFPTSAQSQEPKSAPGAIVGDRDAL
jgi:hypothetical protein